jgi:hypothetical protein
MRNIIALVVLTVYGLLGANPAPGQRLSIPKGNTETELKAEAEKEGLVIATSGPNWGCFILSVVS